MQGPLRRLVELSCGKAEKGKERCCLPLAYQLFLGTADFFMDFFCSVIRSPSN